MLGGTASCCAQLLSHYPRHSVISKGLTVFFFDILLRVSLSFQGFNAAFELQHNTQKHFSVPDVDIRGQLRADNVDIIVPRYKEFLEK